MVPRPELPTSQVGGSDGAAKRCNARGPTAFGKRNVSLMLLQLSVVRLQHIRDPRLYTTTSDGHPT